MREILFRGKRADNSEWVFGYYVKFVPYKGGKAKCFIQPTKEEGTMEVIREVIPGTVGQYTGRLAEDEKKIFEGDKCILTTFDHNGCDYQHEVVVEYLDGAFYFVNDEKEFCMCVAEVEDAESEVVVIGNIHDNPELLEER